MALLKSHGTCLGVKAGFSFTHGSISFEEEYLYLEAKRNRLLGLDLGLKAGGSGFSPDRG